MDKSQIRSQKKSERDNLDKQLNKEWSEVMAQTLRDSFEYQQCEYLHVFLSFGSEPDTRFLINAALNDGKKVVVPVVADGADSMTHSLISAGFEEEAGPFGVPRPTVIQDLPENVLKNSSMLVVVPMLAFNERLFRIGYGKGMYDRFLTKRSFFAFGFAFSMAFSEEFVEEKHDQSLDAIITEQGIVRKRTNPFTVSMIERPSLS